MIRVDFADMPDFMSEKHERLRQARVSAGYKSASAAAEALGVSPSTYRAHENGQNDFDFQDAGRYARRFNVSQIWLYEGKEPDAELTRIKDWMRERKIVDQEGMASPSLPARPTSSEMVRELDSRAGAGGGGAIEVINAADHNGNQISAEVIKDYWQIPKSFLRGELRLDAAKALMIEVTGDSGYDPSNPHAPGSVFPGDRVIVNSGDTRPSPPGPFLVYDGTGFVLKLCEPVHGSDPPAIRLSSRNPSYSPYTITLDDGHVIVGRVVGRFTRM